MNCAQKPEIIYDGMQDYWPHPIVWLDADARVRSRPELFRELYWMGMDFAAHVRESRSHRSYDGEMLSGTLWCANSTRCRDLLSAWIERCIDEPGKFDQRHLAEAVMKCDGLKSHRLPESYCAFDLVMKDHPSTVPVIWHEQASRVMREVVERT